MNLSIIILLVIVVLCANIIQGITGFASGILILPFIVYALGLETGKQILVLFGIYSGIYILLKDYQYLDTKELIKIIIFMGIGLLLGLVLYRLLDMEWLLTLLPVFLILVGIKGLFFNQRYKFNHVLIDNFIIILAGIIHGLFATGGPILIIYISKKIYDKSVFRVTVSTIWIFLNTIIVVESMMNQSFALSSFTHSILLAIPLFIGILIRNKVHHMMNQALFYKLINVLIIILGIMMIV